MAHGTSSSSPDWRPTPPEVRLGEREDEGEARGTWSSIEDGLNPEFPRNGSAFFSGTAASGSGDWKWLLTEGGHHTTFGGKQGFTRWPSTPLYDGSGALASVVHQERGWAYVLFLRAGHLVPQGAPTAVFLVTPSFVSPPCVELPSAAGWR
ncbi:uncharacterized protein BXZ73DRAFT_84694 [Epithele typhae]|uniref:uncharacterized protein n=1 Tax=Epithele typhae TaxID=378194 RepID=UPI00200764AB|nr:uncharacterized protein BXZ73DRAFT_84694 [Epithele typhae]KAH9907108.1 hypothetical protein BXZ73DRAFT_84694 [Epithele typhae]